jgi:anti-sigma B factor antagonist
VGSLQCSVEADQAVLTLAGDVDVAVADDVQSAGFRCLQRTESALVIDLAEVTFMDSSGLGALVVLRNRAEEEGKKVALRTVPRRVRQVLALSHLDEVFPILD